MTAIPPLLAALGFTLAAASLGHDLRRAARLVQSGALEELIAYGW